MFKGLFDFSKQRSVKESVGFFLFYGSIGLAVVSLAEMAGV